MHKTHQDQIFIDLYRMSQRQSNANNQNLLHIPFDNFRAKSSEQLNELTEKECRTLMDGSLCSSRLLLLFQRGSFYWGLMKQLAMEFGLAKPHENVGKKRGVKNDASIYNPVVEYSESLMPLCGVRATKQ